MSASIPTGVLLAVAIGAGSELPRVDLWAAIFPAHQVRLDVRDGSSEIEWKGAGEVQLRMSQAYLVRRDEQIQEATGHLAALLVVVQEARETVDPERKVVVRRRMDSQAAKPLDRAAAALELAYVFEQKRLNLVRKAAALAETAGESIPGLDVEYIKKLRADVEGEEASDRVASRIKALRALAAGMGHFMDGDVFAAVSALRGAAKLAPNIPVIHTYLGSFYYLARQREQAIRHWRRALELDPSDQQLRRTIQNLGLGFL